MSARPEALHFTADADANRLLAQEPLLINVPADAVQTDAEVEANRQHRQSVAQPQRLPLALRGVNGAVSARLVWAALLVPAAWLLLTASSGGATPAERHTSSGRSRLPPAAIVASACLASGGT